MSFLSLRAVQRCVAELRCGAPVLLDGDERWVLLPAETASGPGLEAWTARVKPPYYLAVGGCRAAAIRRDGKGDLRAKAMALPMELLDSDPLDRLADPTNAILPPALAEADLPGGDPQTIVDLAKIAKLLPTMVFARPIDAGGDPALLRIDAESVRAYPRDIVGTLHRVSEATVPLQDIGDTRIIAFRPADGAVEHLAIVIGQPAAQAEPLVRIHSECFTGDLLASLRCDCGPQLHAALHAMAAENHGVVLYMAQEGRGIGLPNKLRAYLLQDGENDRAKLDTLDANQALGWGADERDFAPAAAMLQALGINRIRLMTNNPQKIASLRALNIDVAGQKAVQTGPNGVNDFYLMTKRRRFGHTL